MTPSPPRVSLSYAIQTPHIRRWLLRPRCQTCPDFCACIVWYRIANFLFYADGLFRAFFYRARMGACVHFSADDGPRESGKTALGRVEFGREIKAGTWSAERAGAGERARARVMRRAKGRGRRADDREPIAAGHAKGHARRSPGTRAYRAPRAAAHNRSADPAGAKLLRRRKANKKTNEKKRTLRRIASRISRRSSEPGRQANDTLKCTL